MSGKTIKTVLLVMVLILAVFHQSNTAFCQFSASVTPSGATGGTIDIGQTVSVTFTISGTNQTTGTNIVYISDGEYSATDGLSFINAAFEGGLGQAGANGFASGSRDVTVTTVTLTYTVKAAGSQTVSVSCKLASVDSPAENNQRVSNSYTFNVRSAEEKAAADRAAAEEASRQASIAASQAEENARIASSQAEESLRAAEAMSREQESIDASISESESIEESIEASESEEEESLRLLEEESLAESEKESLEEKAKEDSIKEASESLEEAEAMSEAEVERTRAFEKKDALYIPFRLNDGKRFNFLASESPFTPVFPDGFTEAGIILNRQEVWALRNAEMTGDTYLVYGFYDEDENPELYYYEFERDQLIPYSEIHKETEPLDQENPGFEGSIFSDGFEGFSENLLIPCFIAFIVGGVVSALIVLLIVERKKDEKVPEIPEEPLMTPEASLETEVPEAPETEEDVIKKTLGGAEFIDEDDIFEQPL